MALRRVIIAANPATTLPAALLTILIILISLLGFLPETPTRTRWLSSTLSQRLLGFLPACAHRPAHPADRLPTTVTKSLADVSATQDDDAPPPPPLPPSLLSHDAAADDSPSPVSSDDDGFSSLNEEEGDAASLALELAHAPGPG